MAPPFEKLPGVVSVISGFTGGARENPTYAEVSAGGTGNAEAVQIGYDPSKITYLQLLEVFWKNIDPTDGGGKFVDRGSQFRSAIYSLDEEQKRLAETSREGLAASGRLPGRSSPKSSRPWPFIRPKCTIRTTTRRIRYATSTTVMARAATSFLARSGGRSGARGERIDRLKLYRLSDPSQVIQQAVFNKFYRAPVRSGACR